MARPFLRPPLPTTQTKTLTGGVRAGETMTQSTHSTVYVYIYTAPQCVLIAHTDTRYTIMHRGDIFSAVNGKKSVRGARSFGTLSRLPYICTCHHGFHIWIWVAPHCPPVIMPQNCRPHTHRHTTPFPSGRSSSISTHNRPRSSRLTGPGGTCYSASAELRERFGCLVLKRLGAGGASGTGTYDLGAVIVAVVVVLTFP
jgi:hypothetical protein